jgi:hypothetical protein
VNATNVLAPPRARTRPRAPSRVPWLTCVALAYASAQLAFAVWHIGLGWDETVYVSQVDPRHPAAYFSAPRSRGISLLVAPVLAVTGSTLALRITLALLSAAALYAAFHVWRPLVGRNRSALAALLFAGLWVTVIYGPQAMPNLWVALSAVAATGWFLRALGPHAPRHALIGLAAGVAAATLFRASDAFWLALPLLAGCVLVPAWRRPAPALALIAGLGVGGAEWVSEAYARWGGIPARLHVSSATEGGMGLHWAGDDAWRSLNGPLLCRPCTIALTHPALTVWWLALPLLALAACAVAWRTRQPAHTLLPVACAAALSVPYLVLIDYSAPRFLLPVYALLSLPMANLAAHTARALRKAPAPALTAGALAAAVLALQLATQYEGLRRTTDGARANAGEYRTAAERLRGLGLRPPCLVSGKLAPPIGYYANCASANTGGNNRSITPRALLSRAAGRPTAILTKAGSGPPDYARTWIAHPLRGTGLTAYLRPRQGRAG